MARNSGAIGCRRQLFPIGMCGFWRNRERSIVMPGIRHFSADSGLFCIGMCHRPLELALTTVGGPSCNPRPPRNVLWRQSREGDVIEHEFFTVVLAKMPVKVECIGDGRIIESWSLCHRPDTGDTSQQPQEERTMKT